MSKNLIPYRHWCNGLLPPAVPTGTTTRWCSRLRFPAKLSFIGRGGEREWLADASVAVGVAGEDENLQAVGLGGENFEDALLADLVGVYKDVIKDEDLGFVGG